jgi:hypothetical protein
MQERKCDDKHSSLSLMSYPNTSFMTFDPENALNGLILSQLHFQALNFIAAYLQILIRHRIRHSDIFLSSNTIKNLGTDVKKRVQIRECLTNQKHSIRI